MQHQPPFAHGISPRLTQSMGFLEINREAIRQNYTTLKSLLPKTTCAAVLKADAYGFGCKEIAALLLNEGCTTFFVAHLEEGLLLRSFIKQGQINVLSGFLPDTEGLFIENALTPVINDMGMLKNWVNKAKETGKKLPCILHIDTGMHRLGFDHTNLIQLYDSLSILKGLTITCVMSHLTSSPDSKSSLNTKQKALFDDFRRHFPQAKASLADTGGIYLGEPYHYDIARPGKGLFGLFKAPEGSPPLTPCLKLYARILQVHNAPKGESVGYGATHTLTRKSRLATLGIGFADGYDRRLSNKAFACIQEFKAPVVGCISMDYTVIDVTDVPESLCVAGEWVELVNEIFTLDHLADSIQTISRELSTGFGKRLSRVYK
ncbi:MAG: hypothetical protein ACD_16C00189G0017 [uncultured bacterium]|nr:MAG: hypothetical protein ACD_16C00189G0017 [uncultured bacterium]OFW69195.1 MAG: alanine racemase [Alphaproteobacteria bacterium GWC2_42_16]OFW73880.1 MAG: alanine racemase [Alphaproteobacteria bacterium GWA2_41_27]OFW82735.1 MAG: alanine racemase [Alphaproteobacteria bacterium RIFCSPHIGHO2_12_FULL_42_100]OFW86526.1 MAG: alanine racemase [Alphaproteobacteria bacterium RBG_16_42_14]OFW91889.1 MAG: alanine racemase [Alphaproteobacteria bacterium RIFCSPHIGHO2_02_FULL_42_30]OFW93783.1 MAG: al